MGLVIEVLEEEQKYIIKVLDSRLDILKSAALLADMQKLFNDAPDSIYVDLFNLDFIDSSILGVFVRLHQNAKQLSKKLIFINISPVVKSLFIHTRMDRLFNFE